MSNREKIFRFINEDKYINYFARKYTLLSKKQKKDVSELEIKLNKFISMTVPYTPNYEAFLDYIFPEYEPDLEKFIANKKKYEHPIMPSEIECSIDLFQTTEKESYFFIILVCLARLKIKSGESHIIWQKIKLLLNLCLQNTECEKNILWYMAKIDAEENENIPGDIRNLTPIEIKAHFFTALKKNQFNKAAKILMAYQLISNDTSEKILILDGYEKFINGNYAKAIKELDRIGLQNIDYNPAIWLKLEILSYEGNIPEFLTVINNSHAEFFDYWQLIYYQMELLLNNNNSEISNHIFNQEMEGLKKNYDEPLLGTNYYSYKVIHLMFNICNELIEIYTDIETYKHFDNRIEENDILKTRILKLENIICIYSNSFDKNASYKKKSEQIISICMNLFGNESAYLLSEDNELFYLKECILFLLRTHDLNIISNVVCKYLKEIEIAFEQNNQNAVEIITSYCMQKMLDNQNDCICDKYFPKIADASFITEFNTKKVYNFLCIKAKLAFSAAEWQFAKSQEEDYGWKDAGMLSLGFFRIIEVELNNKLAYPLFQTIDRDTLQKFYPDKDTKYEKKWKSIIDSYNKSDSEFMLGELAQLFRNLGSEFDENDKLACIMKEKLNSILNDSGITAFNQKFFESSINYKIREKFRNPPAHTRYLGYSVACECREYVINFILKLNTLLT